MTLCLLYELDATISVIQNMGTICANICFIHNIGGRHVCKSVKKWPKNWKASDQMRATVGAAVRGKRSWTSSLSADHHITYGPK
jgi:predicted  nucleic acid-binding Zn ribbon protein